MKKRTKLLVASLGGCMLLVGGTFAAWAVTDNADPFNIRVSTGEIKSDTTNYVTLEWGNNTSANIGSLKMNEKRLAAKIELKANVATKEAFTGKFSYTVKQSNNVNAENRLIDNLKVSVYEETAVTGNVGEAATIVENSVSVDMHESEVTVKDSVAAKTGYNNVPVISNNALEGTHKYNVVVSLGELSDINVYSAISEDIVNIEFDWGIKDGEDVVQSKQYYVKGLGGQAYAYAWKGETHNAAWPGVKMEAVPGENDVYSISLGLDYENIIFSTGTWANEEFTVTKQTENLTAITNTNNLFTVNGNAEESGKYNGTWSVFEPSEVVEDAYYLMGENLYIGTDDKGVAVEWNAKDGAKLALTNGVATFDVYTPGNAKLKVYGLKEGLWYGENSYADGTKDFTLEAAGVYTLTFKLEGNPYIHAEQKI